MITNIFERELNIANKRLARQKNFYNIMKCITFGFWKDKSKIVYSHKILLECLDNYNKYIELSERENTLNSSLFDDKIDNIRIGIQTYSDILVTGREDYGEDWNLIREVILTRDNFQCQESDGYCNGVLQVHHIIPLSKGGVNESHNLITLCYYHHSLKHEHMKQNL